MRNARHLVYRLVVDVLNDRAGDASAVKMLRSIMLKGIEALAIECLMVARKQGLLDEMDKNSKRIFLPLLLRVPPEIPPHGPSVTWRP